jgi:hypothetical protein
MEKENEQLIEPIKVSNLLFIVGLCVMLGGAIVMFYYQINPSIVTIETEKIVPVPTENLLNTNYTYFSECEVKESYIFPLELMLKCKITDNFYATFPLEECQMVVFDNKLIWGCKK